MLILASKTTELKPEDTKMNRLRPTQKLYLLD